MANERRCLFCLGSEGKFAGREHIFPETVGNTDLAMLPPGIVCDRCNNGPLSRLDRALCDYLPIAMRRATLGVPNKMGAPATVRFAEGRIEPLPAEAVASGDSHGVRLVDQNPRRPIAHSFEQHDDHVAFKISGQGGRRLTAKYFAELSRAVLKIAVECAYLDHRDEVTTSRFDHVRGVVLGQRDHHGEIALALNGDGKDVRMQCSYMLDDATGIGGAGVNILGVGMVAHADDQPIAPTPGFFIGRF
ncbi:MAG TPA: hypothetical protein VM142_13415 [Acidimicrobiales bacterium]|nr:hypothetical protein [Acidimicrobiales bacterium]